MWDGLICACLKIKVNNSVEDNSSLHTISFTSKTLNCRVIIPKGVVLVLLWLQPEYIPVSF